MEITKINEVVSEFVLRKFDLLRINANDISFEENSYNLIQFGDTTNNIQKNYNVFFSDATNNIVKDVSSFSETKYGVLFNEVIEYLDENDVYFLLGDDKNYILENINITYSTEDDSQVVTATAQELAAFCENKKIIVDFLNLELNNNEIICASFQKKFLHSFTNLKKFRNSGQYLPLIFNPFYVDHKQVLTYSPSMKYMNNFNLCWLKYNANGFILPNEIPITKIRIIIQELLKIINNNKTILSSYLGMEEEQIKEFKKIVWGTNNVKDYIDYSFRQLMIKDTTGTKDIYLTLFKMCSGFLSSSFCIDGGNTRNHENLMPFYFDLVGDSLVLKSNFFDIDFKQEPILLKPKSNFYDFPILPRQINEINVDKDNYELNSDTFKYLLLYPFDKDITSTYQKTNIGQETTTIDYIDDYLGYTGNLSNRYIDKETLIAKAKKNAIEPRQIKKILIDKIEYKTPVMSPADRKTNWAHSKFQKNNEESYKTFMQFASKQTILETKEFNGNSFYLPEYKIESHVTGDPTPRLIFNPRGEDRRRAWYYTAIMYRFRIECVYTSQFNDNNLIFQNFINDKYIVQNNNYLDLYLNDKQAEEEVILGTQKEIVGLFLPYQFDLYKEDDEGSKKYLKTVTLPLNIEENKRTRILFNLIQI